MPPEMPAPQHAKIRTWTLPTILGIIIGIVGALGVVELRPQISVSPQEPIEKLQPFSVPFRIDNTGYLSFYVDRVFCYLNSVEVEHVSIQKGTLHDPSWNRFDLDRGDPKTIICNLQNQINPLGLPKAADIAIVIDYRPSEHFPKSFRKYFRFTGAYVDNWQWLAQPSSPIQADADKEIEEHMKQIPSSR
jgi:AraC-like DNA-binding protein